MSKAKSTHSLLTKRQSFFRRVDRTPTPLVSYLHFACMSSYLTMNMSYSYRVNKDIRREGEDPFALWIHCFHNDKLHPKCTAKASLRHNVHHWHIILFTYFVGSPRHGRETPLHSFHTHGRWGCQEHLCSITEWSDEKKWACEPDWWTLRICKSITNLNAQDLVCGVALLARKKQTHVLDCS